MGKADSGTDSGVTYKRCPECFTKLPLNAKKCPECKQTVMEADKFGLAKTPVDWTRYILVIVLWAALAYFIWWAFVKVQ